MNDAYGGSDHNVEIIITETGWATNGNTNFQFANLENSGIYYKNMLNLMKEKTSKLYNVKIFFFELFDEDRKGSQEQLHEKHFGILDSNGNWKNYAQNMDQIKSILKFRVYR